MGGITAKAYRDRLLGSRCPQCRRSQSVHSVYQTSELWYLCSLEARDMPMRLIIAEATLTAAKDDGRHGSIGRGAELVPSLSGVATSRGRCRRICNVPA
jgi:hypothetical protein